MQEEIKEILEDYKQLAGEITEKLDNTAEYESWLIIQEYFDKLLNNINNLQEYETIIEMEFKREYAKRYLEERRKEEPHLLYPDSDEIYKRYYELKEENERLKELCDKYEEEHKTTFEEWKKDIKANKKAIRQIEIILEIALEQDSENVNLIDRLKGILNILKGDNK